MATGTGWAECEVMKMALENHLLIPGLPQELHNLLSFFRKKKTTTVDVFWLAKAFFFLFRVYHHGKLRWRRRETRRCFSSQFLWLPKRPQLIIAKQKKKKDRKSSKALLRLASLLCVCKFDLIWSALLWPLISFHPTLTMSSAARRTTILQFFFYFFFSKISRTNWLLASFRVVDDRECKKGETK